MNTFVIVKLSVSTDALQMVRDYLSYVSGGGVTLEAFLTTQVEAFRRSFGPECTSEIVQIGTEVKA